MAYNTIIANLSNVRGLHYADSGYLYYAQGAPGQNKVIRTPVNPVTMVDEGAGHSIGISGLDINGVGIADIRYLSWFNGQVTTFGPANHPTKMVELLDVASLDDIDTDTLLAQDWGGAGTGGSYQDDPDVEKFFAVRMYYDTIGGQDIYHYAKVRFYTEVVAKIDWKTYRFDTSPTEMSGPYGDIRDIVVTDFESKIYMTMEINGFPLVAFTQRIKSGPFPVYDLGPTPISALPMTDPQQLAYHEGGLFVADADKVWWIHEQGFGQVEVVSGLTDATGVVVDATDNHTKLYISEANGDIHVVDVSEVDLLGNPDPIAVSSPAFSIGGNAGYLSWANEDHDTLFVTDQTNHEIKRIDLGQDSVETEVSTLGATAWVVEQGEGQRFFVSADVQIDLYERAMEIPEGVIALGVGLIPFDYFTVDGLADTSPAPGYYFSAYPNIPFGGTLSLMINHDFAWESGVRYFRVSLFNLSTNQTRQISAGFVDLHWEEQGGVLKFWPVTSTGPDFTIRDPDDLWYNAHLGAKFATYKADNGQNLLNIEFFDADNNLVDTFKQLIMIDNTRYYTSLTYPSIAGVAGELACGCLTYASKDDTFEFDFTAWHPQGVGTYRIDVWGGGKHRANLHESGSVTPAPVPTTKSTTVADNQIRVGHVIGDCNVANVSVRVYAPSRVTNGFGWVNLSSSSWRNFTLVEGPLEHTPWVGED